MKNRGSKKSENIEVRISYEVKQALYKKAKLDRRTVSDIMRELISGYLDAPKLSTEPYKIESPVMLIKSLMQKPKTLLATVLTVVSTSVFLIPNAVAEDIHLNIEGEIINTNTQATTSIAKRRIETSMTMDSGSTFDIDLGTEHMKVLPRDLILRLTVTGTDLKNSQKGVDIKMKLIEMNGTVENVLAAPHIITSALDDEANFIAEYESGTKVTFKFKPLSKE